MKTTKMKAITATAYGSADVLQLKTIEKPVPGDNEVLIRVYATAVTSAQIAMREGKPYLGRLVVGLTRPKNLVPGTDLAGEVVATGKKVSKFTVGDRVFGSADLAGGTYAEYATMYENGVLLKIPAGVSYEQATAIMEGASTALPFLKTQANLQPGQNILINGASGAIGTAAIQLAKYFGAEVTAVCSSANLALVKSLGADHAIDYQKEDFTAGKNQHDVIFDTVGKSSFTQSKAVLKPNGLYLSPVLNQGLLLDMLKSSLQFKIQKKGKRALFAATGMANDQAKLANLQLISTLMETSKLKAVVDRTYAIDEIPEAHRYVEKGHKKGNVVVKMPIYQSEDVLNKMIATAKVAQS